MLCRIEVELFPFFQHLFQKFFDIMKNSMLKKCRSPVFFILFMGDNFFIIFTSRNYLIFNN